MLLNNLDKRVPISIAGLVLAVYMLTLSPTINSFDSAEFITGAYTLGIIHAPGYPLYLMLAHVVTLIPFVSAPLAVNFLSALLSVSSVVFVFMLSYFLTRSHVWSSTSALILAFSNLFWSRSLIAEVYPLNSLFVILLFFLYVLVARTGSRKFLFVFAFVAGLSFTHHTSVILIVPWLFLFLLFKRNITFPGLVPVALLFLLPLSIYAYFPFRSAANPPLDYMRDYFGFVDLKSLQGILWFVSGNMFQSEIWGRPFGETTSQLLRLVGDLWLNYFGAGFFLAFLGLWHSLKMKKDEGIPTLLAILSVLIFFSAYDVVDNREMIIPAMVLLAPYISVGGLQLQEKWKVSSSPDWPIFFLIAIAGTMMIANWSSVDRHNDRLAYDYSTAVLAEVEPNSLIITQWTAATPLEYLLIVEQQRPDVSIFDRGLFSLGIRARYVACLEKTNQALCAYSFDEALQSYIDQQLPERPVYITEYDPIIKEDYCLISTGNLFRVLPRRACAES